MNDKLALRVLTLFVCLGLAIDLLGLLSFLLS